MLREKERQRMSEGETGNEKERMKVTCTEREWDRKDNEMPCIEIRKGERKG